MAEFKFNNTKKNNKIKLFSGGEESFIKSVNDAHIEMFSNREITVEGCLGVIDYSENYIKIKIKKGTVILSGSDLYIHIYENGTIIIKGKIVTLEFCI